MTSASSRDAPSRQAPRSVIWPWSDGLRSTPLDAQQACTTTAKAPGGSSARHVVVAGYDIETPRLLLNSACPQCPDGVVNSSGLVGKHLMVHSNHGVFGEMDQEIRSY